MFFTGCAVWAYKDWVGDFFPAGSQPKDFLQLYCDRFTAVEGNTTFYSMPDAKTVARWAAVMPPSFRFCPKLPRAFSHQGQLQPYLPQALAFLATLAPLETRLGPVLLQLPPSYSPAQLPDLQAFLTSWPQQQPLTLEVRHPAWFEPSSAQRLNQLLQHLNVGRVLLDTRPIYEGIASQADDPQLASERKKPKLPLQPALTASISLVRYISHPEPAVNQPYLAQWATRLSQWLAQGTEVYFFAHCPQEVRSPAIARQFYHQLQQAGAALPPLPWDQVAAEPSPSEETAQLSLFE